MHPGLFTDEAFAQLSDAAQIFLVGLWTEADDQGLFEWKPLTLKMRLRPASLSPVEPLMDELKAAKCVTKFAVSGRQYGAIRNFQRFQRPKKPNSLYPMPDELRTYVGIKGGGSEPDSLQDSNGSEPTTHETNEVPNKSESPPQMEDGGWKGNGEKEEGSLTGVADKHPLFEAVECWNQICGAVLAPVRRITEQRKRKFATRFRGDFDSSMEVWRQFCGKVASSEFLTGSNDRAWRADFDWTLDPGNTTKILEGGYENRSASRRPPKTAAGEWAELLLQGRPEDDDAIRDFNRE